MKGNVGLPFGLCKKYGIEIGKDWTPKDAWDALEKKTGMTPDKAYADAEKQNISEVSEANNKKSVDELKTEAVRNYNLGHRDSMIYLDEKGNKLEQNGVGWWDKELNTRVMNLMLGGLGEELTPEQEKQRRKDLVETDTTYAIHQDAMKNGTKEQIAEWTKALKKSAPNYVAPPFKTKNTDKIREDIESNYKRAFANYND